MSGLTSADESALVGGGRPSVDASSVSSERQPALTALTDDLQNLTFKSRPQQRDEWLLNCGRKAAEYVRNEQQKRKVAAAQQQQERRTAAVLRQELKAITFDWSEICWIGARQQWLCAGCDEMLDGEFQVDHRIRLSDGGCHNIDNGMAVCRSCVVDGTRAGRIQADRRRQYAAIVGGRSTDQSSSAAFSADVARLADIDRIVRHLLRGLNRWQRRQAKYVLPFVNQLLTDDAIKNDAAVLLNRIATTSGKIDRNELYRIYAVLDFVGLNRDRVRHWTILRDLVKTTRGLYDLLGNIWHRFDVEPPVDEPDPILPSDAELAERRNSDLMLAIKATGGRRFERRKIRFAPSVRLRIAAGQRWKCNYCQELLPRNFDIDHVVPIFLCGQHTIQNAQAVCKECHIAKSIVEAGNDAWLTRAVNEQLGLSVSKQTQDHRLRKEQLFNFRQDMRTFLDWTNSLECWRTNAKSDEEILRLIYRTARRLDGISDQLGRSEKQMPPFLRRRAVRPAKSTNKDDVETSDAASTFATVACPASPDSESEPSDWPRTSDFRRRSVKRSASPDERIDNDCKRLRRS
jgi:5-methylcytosine-specific restriction endonuclease McrA